VLPFFHAIVAAVVVVHQRNAHAKIGDALLGVVFGDALKKSFYGLCAEAQLVLLVGSNYRKFHLFLLLRIIARVIALSYPLHCPILPDALGTFARHGRLLLPVVPGNLTHSFGQDCLNLWAGRQKAG